MPSAAGSPSAPTGGRPVAAPACTPPPHSLHKWDSQSYNLLKFSTFGSRVIAKISKNLGRNVVVTINNHYKDPSELLAINVNDLNTVLHSADLLLAVLSAVFFTAVKTSTTGRNCCTYGGNHKANYEGCPKMPQAKEVEKTPQLLKLSYRNDNTASTCTALMTTQLVPALLS
ncbi:hypothetical protein FHG87_010748 [Trinorchestia longiramus]|nr:hypothetical protein FHG87_010748 [Trinorchestia longiramus]